MNKLRRFAILPVAMLVLAACQADEGSGSPGASEPAGSGAAGGGVCETHSGDDHLGRICEAGVIRVSTDPAYPPQSFLNEETGEYEGFDIDTATEIAARLGVDIEFTDPTFDAVVAGAWADRWDMSVGSITVTAEREEVLDFTQPYYFTPAQMAVLEDSDIQSLDDLAGRWRAWLSRRPTCSGSRGRCPFPSRPVRSRTRRTGSLRPPSRPTSIVPRPGGPAGPRTSRAG